MSKHKKNPHAVSLGKLAAGVPKDYSPEERRRRAEHARKMTVARVAKRKAKGEQ